MSSDTDKLFALVLGTLLSLIPVFIWTLHMPWDASQMQVVQPAVSVSPVSPLATVNVRSAGLVQSAPLAPCESTQDARQPRSVLTSILLAPPAPPANGAVPPAAPAAGLEL